MMLARSRGFVVPRLTNEALPVVSVPMLRAVNDEVAVSPDSSVRYGLWPDHCASYPLSPRPPPGGRECGQDRPQEAESPHGREDRTQRDQVRAGSMRPRTSPSLPAAQHHLVAVLEERARRAVGERRPAPPRSSSARAASRARPAPGPEIVPEPSRSPVRSVAPLTVRWAICWATLQYSWRAFVRAMTVPLSSTSSATSNAHGSSCEVGERRRIRGSRRGALEGVERDDPVADRGRERLPQEGAERHGLPGLDVAGAPVVEQHDAEDVVERAVDRDRLAAAAGRADHEAQLELDVEASRRAVLAPPELAAGPHDRVPLATIVPDRPW